MQLICKCWPTCSVVEYKIAYTSHYDDWAYMKLTNIVKNKYVTDHVSRHVHKCTIIHYHKDTARYLMYNEHLFLVPEVRRLSSFSISHISQHIHPHLL